MDLQRAPEHGKRRRRLSLRGEKQAELEERNDAATANNHSDNLGNAKLIQRLDGFDWANPPLGSLFPLAIDAEETNSASSDIRGIISVVSPEVEYIIRRRFSRGMYGSRTTDLTIALTQKRFCGPVVLFRLSLDV